MQLSSRPLLSLQALWRHTTRVQTAKAPLYTVARPPQLRLLTTWTAHLAKARSHLPSASASPLFASLRHGARARLAAVRHGRRLLSDKPAPSAPSSSSSASGSSPATAAAGESAAEAAPPETMSRFKSMWRSYGYLFVGSYFGLYFVTLGGCFTLVHNGVVKGPDVNTWLNKSSFKAYITDKDVTLSPLVTELLTAWLITKTTEPLRFGATVVAVPLFVRFLPMTVLRFLRVHVPASRLKRESLKQAASKMP